MSNLASFGASYLASKGLDWAFNKLGDLVLRRCSERRLAAFLETFLDAVQRSEKNGCLPEVLDHFMEDEEKREILFDAYRRVVFSRTVEIGPKIIALITAERMIGNLNETHEEICRIAERFSDDDYPQLTKCLEDNRLSRACSSTRYEDHDSEFNTNLLREEWPRCQRLLHEMGLWEQWQEFDVTYHEEREAPAGISKTTTYCTQVTFEVFDLLDYYKRVVKY